jgi:uncharacterized Zn-finger protein
MLQNLVEQKLLEQNSNCNILGQQHNSMDQLSLINMMLNYSEQIKQNLFTNSLVNTIPFNNNISTFNNCMLPNLVNNNQYAHKNIKQDVEILPTNTSRLNSQSNIITSLNNNNIQTQQDLVINPEFEKNKQKDISEDYFEPKPKFYIFTFNECDMVFNKECHYKDHVRTHTREKPYQCSIRGCRKIFSQHGNLKKHEKVHSGDKRFTCSFPNCGKKFTANYNLKVFVLM